MSRRDDDVLPWIFGAGAAGLAAYFFWTPVKNAVVTATRQPQDIFDAVAEIDPQHNPELQPGYLAPGDTWCNKFMYEVLSKLGVTIPFAPTLVNDQISYIDAGNDGWYPVSADDAQAAALNGNIAIATYYNLGGHGHMALVLPIPGTLQIAQAGAVNFNQGSVQAGFGLSISPQFYAHA